MSPSAIRDFLLAEGFQAKIDREDEGLTIIKSGVSGIPFAIMFFRGEPYDGNVDAYDGMMFTAGISIDGPPDLAKLNVANSNTMCLRAYHEFDAIWIEMGVPVPDSGLPDEMFEEYFACWTDLVPEFVQEVI